LSYCYSSLPACPNLTDLSLHGLVEVLHAVLHTMSAGCSKLEVLKLRSDDILYLNTMSQPLEKLIDSSTELKRVFLWLNNTCASVLLQKLQNRHISCLVRCTLRELPNIKAALGHCASVTLCGGGTFPLGVAWRGVTSEEAFRYIAEVHKGVQGVQACVSAGSVGVTHMLHAQCQLFWLTLANCEHLTASVLLLILQTPTLLNVNLDTNHTITTLTSVVSSSVRNFVLKEFTVLKNEGVKCIVQCCSKLNLLVIRKGGVESML